MVIQMGYNLLYGLHKASYDADCSLFLGVLRGDVKEDVYIQTAQLQVVATNSCNDAGHASGTAGGGASHASSKPHLKAKRVHCRTSSWSCLRPWTRQRAASSPASCLRRALSRCAC
jgi:hypothetical protein